VQQEVETALARLFQQAIRAHSASRTDAGVHALGMTAHFDVPAGGVAMAPAKLALGLNAWLPPEIRVMGVRRVGEGFHARFSARGKQYRYQVWNASGMNPLLWDRAWHVPVPLDLVAMRAAAGEFLGERDFKAFAATREYEMASTVRTVWRCDVSRRGPLLTVVIEGDGFLYKMCRGIAGTLVQVGQGKYEPAAVGRMLAGRDRRLAGMTAPAHGLVLQRVYYRLPAAARLLGRGGDAHRVVRA
jgi:tRNA pseudouridine38-40 synthase